MIAPEPVAGETMVQWQFHDLNNLADIASQDYYTEPVGSLVGGDDALYDGSDSTYLECAASGEQVSWKMRPLQPVPSSPVIAVSYWARYVGSIPPGTGGGLDPRGFHIVDQFPWISIFPDRDTLGEGYQHRRTGVFVRVVSKVIADYPSNFWILRPTGYARLVEYAMWTHHEGGTPLPLRQRQRDDGLGPGGAIRGRGGSSVQGSIRQRGYW